MGRRACRSPAPAPAPPSGTAPAALWNDDLARPCGDAQGVDPGRALEAHGQGLTSEPLAELGGVTADPHPGDALGAGTVLRRHALGVALRGDLPGDEEREPGVAERDVEACGAPADAGAVGEDP